MSIRLRLGLLLGLCVAAVAAAAWQFVPGLKHRASSPAQPTVPSGIQVGRVFLTEDPPPPENISAVAFASLPGAVEDLYRVRPDRRVLYAVAEIHRLASGDQEPRVRISFRKGGWEIRLGDVPAGRLPEIPSYDEALVFLRNWGAQEVARAARPPQARADPAALRPLEDDFLAGSAGRVLRGLKSLNAAGEREPADPELRRLGLRGLLWLSVQSMDLLQLSDPVLGSALGLRALIPDDSPREDALLAFLLGYEDAARRAALSLPERDADRLFVLRRNAELERLATSGRERRSWYLHLVRLAESRDSKRWFETLKRSPWADDGGLSVLAAAQRLQSFSAEMDVAGMAIVRAFGEVFSASFPDPEPWKPPLWDRLPWREARRQPLAQLASFEKKLARQSAKFGGAVITSDVTEGYYRAAVYSGAYEAARFLFDSLGSTPHASSLAVDFIDPPPGTAAELRRWMESRISLREADEKGRTKVAQDLAELKNIGVAPLARIRYSVYLYLRHKWDSSRRTPMRGYFRALDTRPSNLAEAGLAAWENLCDLARAEKFLRPAIEKGGVGLGNRLPFLLRLSGDAGALKALVEDVGVAPEVRSEALRQVSEAGWIEAADLQRFASRLEETPLYEGSIQAALVRHYEKKEDWGAAEAILRQWLARHEALHDLTWAHATTSLCRILRRTGRLDEAWERIGPAAETWAAASMEEAALILLAKGDTEAALRTAEKLRDRYPEGGHSHALLAEIFWRSGEPEAAAGVLQKARTRVASSDWSTQIAPRFRGAYENVDGAQVEKAFSILAAQGFPARDLVAVSREFGLHGRPDLAARIGAMVANDPPSTLTAYRFLRQSQGSPAALEWIRGRVPKPSPDFATAIFQERCDELLWDLFPEPRSFPNPALLQMLRGAALCRSRKLDDPRVEGIREAVRGDPNPKGLLALASYFVGLSDREALLGLPDSRENLCYVAWAFGLKEASGRRYFEANDWMQVALEAGTLKCLTWGWAWETVGLWRDSLTFLPALERSGLL
jgi:hypothetical protein